MIKCPNCGTTITEAVETTGNASDKVATKPNNEKMDSFKKNSLNYFQWFKNTIKHPSEVEQDNQYFGLVSFLINVLLIAYSFYILGNKILTMVIAGMQDSMGILGYEESTPKMDIPTGISLYLKLFFVVLAYFLIFILIGFLAKKYFIDEKINLYKYSNELAGFSNSLIIVEIITILSLLVSLPSNFDGFGMAQLGAFKFLIILIVVHTTIWLVSYISSIVISNGKMKLDKIYIAVLTLIADNIVLYFVGRIISNSLIAKYSIGLLNGLLG